VHEVQNENVMHVVRHIFSMMAMMTTEACCQAHARHNISLDYQHGDQFFDQVAAAVTPSKLTSACFIGNNYKDLITFMCSDERTVPIINVDPRQDLHRQGVMVGAALTMGHIYGGAMGAILAGCSEWHALQESECEIT